MTDVEGENPGAPLTQGNHASVEMQASSTDATSNPLTGATLSDENGKTAPARRSGAPLAPWELIKLPGVPLLSWFPKYEPGK